MVANISSGPQQTMRAIEEIHLINLDRSPDRLARFMERNGHLTSIIRVPAVDGARIDRGDLIRENIISADLSYSNGTLGCAMSHIALWQRAVAEDRNLTIFEDDLSVSHDFLIEANKILADLPPEWDTVHWGYCFHPTFVWVDLGVSKAKLEFYELRYLDAPEPFSRSTFRRCTFKLSHVFGTQAYTVSPKGARLMLDHCLPLRDGFVTFQGAGVTTRDVGIDVALCGLYDSMQSFICLPPLAINDDGLQSDRISTDRGEASRLFNARYGPNAINRRPLPKPRDIGPG